MSSIPTSPLPQPVDGKVYIYALMDPRTAEVRYVGQTYDPRARYRSHLSPKLHQQHTHKARWVQSLITVGVYPKWRTLELVSVADRDIAERRQIARFRELGCKLTNATDGGYGTGPRRVPTQAVNAAQEETIRQLTEERDAWRKAAENAYQDFCDELKRAANVEFDEARALTRTYTLRALAAELIIARERCLRTPPA